MIVFLLPILAKVGKYLIYIIPAILFCLFLWKIYEMGVSHGEKIVQANWDKDKLAYSQEILKVQNENEAKEQLHQKESLEINAKLASVEDQHQKAIATINADYAGRLLDSEQRAEIYKRQAQGGTIGCQRLASHAAELDRSLEQGRELVSEFRETLGQRDEQIRQLSSQITADRTLLDDGSQHD